MLHVVSDAHALVGRPDYIQRMGDQLIPVERNSRQLGSGAYEGELLQLAVYCLLVEERFGKPGNSSTRIGSSTSPSMAT